MKKFLLFLFCFSASSLLADIDLLPDKFKPLCGKTAIVSGQKWFAKALSLSADEKNQAKAVYTQTFPFYQGYSCEISADVKTSGTAFIELQLLDADGKLIHTCKIAKTAAAPRSKEIEGELKTRHRSFPTPPTALRVIIGVEKNGEAIFEDIELDIDDD